MGYDEILKDIGKMNESFDNPKPEEAKDNEEEVEIPSEEKEDKEESTEKSTDDSKKEDDETSPKEEDEKDEKAEKPPAEEKPKEKETSPKEEQKPDEKDEEITQLKAELAVLKAEKDDKEEEDTSESKAKPEEEDKDIDFFKDMSDDDFDEVTSSKENFNKLLTSVYRAGTSRAETAIMNKLSTVIEEKITEKETVKALAEVFYTANKRLRKFPKVVRVVFNELAAKHRDKTYEQVMNLVADECYDRLGIEKPKPGDEEKEEKPTEDKDDSNNKPPRSQSRASNSSRSRTETSQEDRLNQFDEMEKALEKG